jgi:hypothetical protein
MNTVFQEHENGKFFKELPDSGLTINGMPLGSFIKPGAYGQPFRFNILGRLKKSMSKPKPEEKGNTLL